jgi:hypothetical protein
VVDTSDPGPPANPQGPICAARTALRRLARRYQVLSEEIKDADREIGPLVTKAAPKLVALPGVGPETAGHVPASSSRTNRHRLNRGGDRAANNALHTIVLLRMKYDQRTQEYVVRRTAEGMVKKDIVRCLKRIVARQIYRHLPHVTRTTKAPPQTA